MFKWITLAGVALSLMTPSAAYAETANTQKDVAVPDGKITFDLQTIIGTGCPPGTTAIDPAKDKTAFTVTYSAFEVFGGSYKNCQLGVTVHVPQGWTYAIHKVDNRGYAYLDDTANAKVLTTSYFTGESWTIRSNRKIQGPYDDAWQTTDYADVLAWARCDVDRDLHINNTVRVKGPKTSSVSMSSTDASISTVFHLKWKTCDGKRG